MFQIGDRVRSTSRLLYNRQGSGVVTHYSEDGEEFHVEYRTRISQRTQFGLWHKRDTRQLKKLLTQ